MTKKTNQPNVEENDMLKGARQMILTFKIILMIITGISFLGAVGEKDNENLRSDMAGLCIASILAFVVLVLIA